MSLPLHSRSWAPDPALYTRVILGLVLPGVGLTTVLLGLYGYAAWNTVSRRYLDRVSFRLLTYALIAHLFFGIFFTIATFNASPGWRCALLSFITDSALVFSAGMFFSIALNLLLVLAFNRNGRKMEKYYVLGISLVCLITNLAPFASGNPLVNETCWYRSEDPAAMLRWLVGTQTVWVLLDSLGEVVAFIILMGYLPFASGAPLLVSTFVSLILIHAGLTILRFRNIILRIGLYPLVSCMFNISTAVIDFYLSWNFKVKHIDAAALNWRLNLADLAIYSGRPLIYGLLAATDPSFIRALRALRHPENESEVQSQAWGLSATMSTVIDLQDVPDSELELDKDDGGSSTQAQTGSREMFTTSTAGTDPEVAKERRPDNGRNGTRESIDFVSHI
ncbi:hypothetical protein MSAN_00421500 [Mycena sanguinolenta]|uniref:Uncharacterized protein n=1 Tax=Mycena sanguinolenta TaxID=230812 RepID=A0A8H7DK70_9AGAR|nr:hypothetical protein MSAN_00421500 [Mycena sanguinolenta]